MDPRPLSELENARRGRKVVQVGIGVPLLALIAFLSLCAMMKPEANLVRIAVNTAAIVYAVCIVSLMTGAMIARNALGLNPIAIVVACLVLAIHPVLFGILIISILIRFNRFYDQAELASRNEASGSDYPRPSLSVSTRRRGLPEARAEFSTPEGSPERTEPDRPAD